jgi:hypothetical protein
MDMFSLFFKTSNENFLLLFSGQATLCLGPKGIASHCSKGKPELKRDIICFKLLTTAAGPKHVRGNQRIYRVRYINLISPTNILTLSAFSTNNLLFGKGLFATLGLSPAICSFDTVYLY